MFTTFIFASGLRETICLIFKDLFPFDFEAFNEEFINILHG